MCSTTLQSQPDGPTRVIKFIAPATASTPTSSALFSPSFLVRRASTTTTAAQRSTGATVGQRLSPPPSINSTPERSRARSERGVLTDDASSSSSSTVSSGVSSGSADTLALRLYCSAIRVSVVDVSAGGEMLLGRQVIASYVLLVVLMLPLTVIHNGVFLATRMSQSYANDLQST
eukprot:16277-Heterococcus_DN1.PRE.1